MSPPPRPPPALLDDLIEEALLRVRPDDPASLVHASLVCRRWHRLISGRRFRRRYREFHRSPPTLGFFYHNSPRATRFMTTSSFRLPRGDRTKWHAIDARHGRIVFHVRFHVRSHSQGRHMLRDTRGLVVVNPITGEQQRLPMPGVALITGTWNAAVVCAVAGCDHVDCPSGGPFTIVFVCTHVCKTSACTFSSKTGCWSRDTSVQHPDSYVASRSALVGNMLCFILRRSNQILEYDLGRQDLSVISPPPSLSLTVSADQHQVCADPFTTRDGNLGLGIFDEPRLYLWSREAGLHGHEWVQQRVFELDKLLHVGSIQISPLFCGIMDDNCVIFMGTRDGLFTIDLKSGQVRKLLNDCAICDIVPYMSFCTPASRQTS